ncbi:MAG: thioesterase family protein [Desulfobacteraceae bacterium]|jgi:thioesterase-3
MLSKTEITVRGYHIDHFGHVNHARYVELLEEARWRYLEDNSLIEPIHEIGAFHVVTEISIQYRHAARVGDILCFETRVTNRSTHSFMINQKIYLKPSEKLAVEAIVTNVFINPKGRTKLIDSSILDAWPDLASAEVSDSFRLGI